MPDSGRSYRLIGPTMTAFDWFKENLLMLHMVQRSPSSHSSWFVKAFFTYSYVDVPEVASQASQSLLHADCSVPRSDLFSNIIYRLGWRISQSSLQAVSYFFGSSLNQIMWGVPAWSSRVFDTDICLLQQEDHLPYTWERIEDIVGRRDQRSIPKGRACSGFCRQSWAKKAGSITLWLS